MGRTRSSGPTPTRSTRHCSTSSATWARPADTRADQRTGRRAGRRTDEPTDRGHDGAVTGRSSPREARISLAAPARWPWPEGLPGDQVELVAFDVGEGRPAGLVGLQVAEPPGAQAQQALGLGLEGALAGAGGGGVFGAFCSG